MGTLERLAIVVALAAACLAVVAGVGCGSVDAVSMDAGAGGTGGGAAGQAAGAGGARGGAGGGAGDVGGRGGAAGDVDVDAGQADAVDAGDAHGLVACGAPVRNVGVSCPSMRSDGLACATCVGAADSAPRYDCRGSISGAPVYCFGAGVPSDVAGCESCR